MTRWLRKVVFNLSCRNKNRLSNYGATESAETPLSKLDVPLVRCPIFLFFIGKTGTSFDSEGDMFVTKLPYQLLTTLGRFYLPPEPLTRAMSWRFQLVYQSTSGRRAYNIRPAPPEFRSTVRNLQHVGFSAHVKTSQSSWIKIEVIPVRSKEQVSSTKKKKIQYT